MQSSIGRGRSHAARQLLEFCQPRWKTIGCAGLGQFLKSWPPSLITMELIGSMPRVACAGVSATPSVGDVKRTVNESPYMMALATTLRRKVIAYGPTRVFQVIFYLPVGVSTAMILFYRTKSATAPERLSYLSSDCC